MTFNEHTSPFSARAESVKSSFLRDILKAAGQEGVISFAGGLPEPGLFPKEQLAASAYRVLIQSGTQALQYTNTEGYYPLRAYIAQRYKTEQGLDVTPEQILITSGSQQALDLISKLFLDPGDAILMERPSYLGAIQCFSQYSPEILEVELNEDGPDPKQLRSVLQSRMVKFFYTIPNYQNPTGGQHSLSSRLDTASVFKTSNTYIIEDDPYGEIRFDQDRIPSLYSMHSQRTIVLGSFSKIVAPGIRIGWALASEEIILKLTVLKQASDLHSSNLDQHIVYDYVSQEGLLDQHIEKIKDLYRQRRDTMLKAMKEFFPQGITYHIPQGGMFLWIEFPGSINAMDLLRLSMKEGIVFVPGETFYVSHPNRQTARFNFSNTDETKTREAIKKLGMIIKSKQ